MILVRVNEVTSGIKKQTFQFTAKVYIIHYNIIRYLQDDW